MALSSLFFLFPPPKCLNCKCVTLYRLFVYESGFYYRVQESLNWQQFSCLSLACWDYRLCCHTQQHANVLMHKKQMQPGVRDLISDFLSPDVPSFRITDVCCHSPSKVFVSSLVPTYTVFKMCFTDGAG